MSRDYGGAAKSVTSINEHPSYKPKAESEGDLFQGLKIGTPPMPGELGQIAKNMWVFIGSRLQSVGLISEIDLSILRRYCVTYELYVKAEREVLKKGEYQKTPNQYMQLSPWAVSLERYSSRLLKLEDRLFLSPKARQAVKIENPNQGGLDLD